MNFENRDRCCRRCRRCLWRGFARALCAGQGAVLPAAVLPHRPLRPNGTPWANGKQDYLKLINARDGGINGVKVTFEECETGYATDRGVECYERLKSRPA